MTTKQHLEAARAVIADPARWASKPSELEEPKNCALTALYTTGDMLTAAKQKLYDQLEGEKIARFNDTHTHAEVLDLYDRAITSCDGE